MINLIISFFLDGLLSIYQKTLHITPMFSIVALIFLFLRYHKDSSFYYKACLFAGFIYDLLYTNTFPLNTLIFLLLGFIISKLYLFFSNNLLNGIIINLLVLIIYKLVTFVILVLIGYLPFNFVLILDNLLSIILTNTFFFIFIYIVFKEHKRKISRYGL
ncbi:MAG TPA: rod shape-determining protein MreD [Mollicutes bacterium]|nr:rod shape-determining protein MreD [Mollicutes bacterium]